MASRIALYNLGPTWTALLVGTAGAPSCSPSRWRWSIGLFSLRVRAIFFAMITLAVASAFAILASQLSDLTGGEDGRTFQAAGTAAARISPVRARPVRRRDQRPHPQLLSDLLRRAVLFLLLLRVVNSPFGRVLQAIRENEFRAEAIGYRTVVYRTLANCLAAAAATLGRRALRAVAALHRARQ